VCIILFAGKYFICKVYFFLTLLFRPWQRCDVDMRTRKPRCGSLHRFLNYWHTSKWHWSCAFSIAENLVKINIFIKIYIHLSQKNRTLYSCTYLPQILTDFHISFTLRLSGDNVTTGSLKILPDLKCVATLPCETLAFKNHRTRTLTDTVCSLYVVSSNRIIGFFRRLKRFTYIRCDTAVSVLIDSSGMRS